MNVPPALASGDIIRVVAPSGPFDEKLLKQGLARLKDFEVQLPDGLIGRREGFLAGSDDTRRKELQDALDCPHAKAILVARGGYGLSRITPELSWNGFKKHPKWVIGFSDVTALHQEVLNAGFLSLHAANGTTLSRLNQDDFDETVGLLKGVRSQTFDALESWQTGTAEGVLVGGNLTVLFAEAAAGRLTIPDGAVLFLEDVTETSYRIDRMLTALSTGGHFRSISALVLGEFLDCSPGQFDVATSDILRDATMDLGVPVVANAPIGHGARNRPLLLGATAQVDGSQGQMTIRLPE